MVLLMELFYGNVIDKKILLFFHSLSTKRRKLQLSQIIATEVVDATLLA